jgi:toxin ParE1/3/4
LKRLIIAASAHRDLEQIHDYIAKDSADAASQWIDRLVSQFDILSAQPGVGRKRNEIRSGYRSIAEGDYVIFYRLAAGDAVEIVRIIHGKRNLNEALKD